MKSKRYPNLYKKAGQPNWVFSKYSSVKVEEFRISTGIPATDANAAAAYRMGSSRFDEWLGGSDNRVRNPLVRDIGKIVLEGKAAKSEATRLKVDREIRHHINPAFGHLRPSQVTPLRLQEYETEERQKGRTSLFNTRKYLFEILRLAREEGLIKCIPKWKLSDPTPEPPKFIDAATFRKIRRLAIGPEKLVLFILYWQGARPREVLRYRWEMIDWKDATLHIPAAVTKTRRARSIPLNSRVARVLRRYREESGFLFPKRRAVEKARVVYDREWLAAVKVLGLDYSVYNLRDSFISRKLLEGVSSIYIARYVDSSVSEIEKRYAVPVNEVMRRIAG